MPAGQSLEAIEYFPYPEQAGVYYNYRWYQYSTVPVLELYQYQYIENNCVSNLGYCKFTDLRIHIKDHSKTSLSIMFCCLTDNRILPPPPSMTTNKVPRQNVRR
jgi:hypothetical protein